MLKIFAKDTKFKVIVYGEQCAPISWQDMLKACFSAVKKVFRVS